ncbi:MAG: thioredoxin family protein [Actinobacteria bacterium]|nr:thioredoxin family protein [Actinomycetota bacterium]HPE14190.1 thioredoxin family protein [Actinomycetota bacterium]HPJ19860.1 thioredoxin family protein [Actinomycetota bacterium]HPQ84955.1 thioredoxin family protein [Actinomycetota bacterium]HRV67648.1 thioredoxin family protein [Candidatus Nanopelagicales bacterium]
MKKIALATPALAALLLAGCGSSSEETATPTASETVAESPAEVMEESPSADAMEKTPEVMVTGGQYVTETQYREDPAAFQEGNTVLFFYAPWCPDCQETDKSIQQTGVPDDINIVKIDFDNANDLRKKYGVTQQHTFVLIGADGEEIKKWTGSFSAEDINAKAT